MFTLFRAHTMTDQQPLLDVQGLRKSFGGTPVLTRVDLALLAGEVHVLLGENGAGKSTLTKILSGVHSPDAGKILLAGRPVTFRNPAEAQNAGIALMHQEPQFFPELTIAENIFLGRQPTRGPLKAVDWNTMNRQAAALLDDLGVSLDPKRRMQGLSVASQQMVEMARALSLDARVLIMDEPTAALTPGEVADLFRIMRQVKAKGAAVVFISHRLEEVFEIGDRITVLRDGAMVGTVLPRETDRDEIIRLMVGREITTLYEKTGVPAGEVRLQVEDLTLPGRFSAVSFTVRSGEIVGLAGLVGAGRTEVAESIFGIRLGVRGTVRVGGEIVTIRSPQKALKAGLAYVPEDRQRHGLLLPVSIAQNITLPQLRRFARRGWMQSKRERTAAHDITSKLHLRAARDMNQPVGELSGGNQQKVSLAKWLLTQPRVLILDEPTRGIDIGAKAEVHRLMGELAAQGIAILMISSDLPEVLALSDRVLVMREGRLTGEFSRDEATQENIMAAATGQATAGVQT